jgi:APA family basic amino acid/polyamine antiporter
VNLFRTKPVESFLADAAAPGRQLKRTLNTWDLMIMGVAVAVGAGIFSVGARAAANFSGPAVTLSFVIAALTCAMAIMCYAEFATAIPVAGSAYVFSYATMGEFVAWIIGWNLVLELFTAAAVIAKYWGIYLTEVFQLVGVHLSPTIELGIVTMSWGPFLIVALFTILLVLGTKLSATVSNVFTVIKIGVVLFVIVVGFFYVKAENYAPFIPDAVPASATDGTTEVMKQSLFAFATGAAPAQYGMMGVFAGAALVFFAFVGFDVVATSAEEVKNPSKTLPRGIFAGLALTTLLYIGVSLALTGMVSYKDLAAVDTPNLATAFTLVGNEGAASVIAVGSLIGLTTVVMVLLMGLSRVVLAMSRDGLLPYRLSKTGKRNTPARIQIICGSLVAIVAGVTRVDVLEEMINIGTLSAFVVVSLGIIVLRRKRPDLKPAFRVPFGPFIPITSALLCTYLMLNLAVETWIYFALWLAVGVVIYFGYGQRHSRLNEKFALQMQAIQETEERASALKN